MSPPLLPGLVQRLVLALGAAPASREVVDMVGLADEPHRVSHVDDLGRTHLRGADPGLVLVVDGGVVTEVVVRTRTYPQADALVVGLAGDATRAQVRERFGPPQASTDEADAFGLDGYVQRAYYADDRLVALVLVVRG
ncbi:hypothetical protein GCM10028777_30430 [Angustibacter speluncae]